MRQMGRKGRIVQMEMAEVAVKRLWPQYSLSRSKAAVKAAQMKGCSWGTIRRTTFQ